MFYFMFCCQSSSLFYSQFFFCYFLKIPTLTLTLTPTLTLTRTTKKLCVPTRPLPSPSHLDHQAKLRANQTALGVPTRAAALFTEMRFCLDFALARADTKNVPSPRVVMLQPARPKRHLQHEEHSEPEGRDVGRSSGRARASA